MASQNKVSSYAGFAVKSRKIVYGASLIGQFKKRVYVLLLCSTASENTVKEALRLADRHGIDIVVSKTLKLEEVVNKANCKLAAVTDGNLAKAILEHTDSVNFVILERGGALNG